MAINRLNQAIEAVSHHEKRSRG